jgi:hypothetical protein
MYWRRLVLINSGQFWLLPLFVKGDVLELMAIFEHFKALGSLSAATVI